MTMSFRVSLILIFLAVAFDGIVAGASLDQVIKQLPARHEIGPKAFSAYSQAADLSNGIIWYATIGKGSALFTVAAAISIFRQRSYSHYSIPIYIAAVLSVAHCVVTAYAAPTNFQQLEVSDDEQALIQVFDHFEQLSLARAVLQVTAFGAMLLGLYVRLGHRGSIKLESSPTRY
jgi:hypothetical protein